MPSLFLSSLAAGLLFVSGLGSAPPTTSVAIVAHPSTSVARLSVQDLRRIYTGEARTFQDVCIQRRLADGFFEAVTGQSARAVGRRWVRLLLSGRVAEGPISHRTDAETMAHVRAHPGAIGFVSPASLTAGAGVTRIPIRGDGADANGFVVLGP